MNSILFKKLWDLSYPYLVPITHLYKIQYPTRWLRIHSLPSSKRYPANKNEEQLLLARQNQLFNDLIGSNNEFFIVIGLFDNQKMSKVYSQYDFQQFAQIDLSKQFPTEYDEISHYTCLFSAHYWQDHNYDKMLLDIANDNSRATFVSFTKNILIAPYDGGVDIIFATPKERNLYKERYQDWLSHRDDGL